MNTYYSADYILPVSAPAVKNGCVSIDENDVIQGVYSEYDIELLGITNIKRYSGILTPGFVNTHCHLELSWLKDRIPQKEGLIAFIQHIINQVKHRKEDNMPAMSSADKLMHENGIVAVGDISNGIDSRRVKLESHIYYHTFVEILGFDPEKAKDLFRAACEINEAFSPLPSSIVPHAPYTISKELLRFISRFCGDSSSLMSIHNQESEEENMLYRYKTGAFLDFYKRIGLDIGFFKAQARSSIQSIFPHLSKTQKILLVHNTYTSLKDIYFTKRTEKDIYWCFCPNANLYIENRLPKIDLFRQNDLTITLGTDSLASNKNLCILSELKTIHKYFPSLSLEETIKWATLNGAGFLNMEQQLGSLTVGKKPGLNLISNVEGLKLSPASKVQKLV